MQGTSSMEMFLSAMFTLVQPWKMVERPYFVRCDNHHFSVLACFRLLI